MDVNPAKLCLALPDGSYREASRDEIMERANEYALRDALARGIIDVPSTAVPICRALVGGYEHEKLGVVFMDIRHRVISAEILFRGTIDGAVVYPREVIKRTLALNANSVILCHNHPSGDPTPSEMDRQLTLKIAKALKLIEVRLLDHIVIGTNSHISMAEKGLTY